VFYGIGYLKCFGDTPRRGVPIGSYKINYILTDNGFEFCYKALPKHRQRKKIHLSL